MKESQFTSVKPNQFSLVNPTLIQNIITMEGYKMGNTEFKIIC